MRQGSPVLPSWDPTSLWSPPLSQVLLVQFKGTGKYYAIKALKKQEVLSRDEIERYVVTPWGTWPWGVPRVAGLRWRYQRAAECSRGFEQVTLGASQA